MQYRKKRSTCEEGRASPTPAQWPESGRFQCVECSTGSGRPILGRKAGVGAAAGQKVGVGVRIRPRGPQPRGRKGRYPLGGFWATMIMEATRHRTPLMMKAGIQVPLSLKIPAMMGPTMPPTPYAVNIQP